MPVYSVFEIPKPAEEAHVTGYSIIRLLGLQTDAYAFGSTYERESKFSGEQWRERLDTPGRMTFVAHTSPGESSTETLTWVGTASLLGPEMLEAVNYTPPKHLLLEDEVPYVVVGMWMHPEHRRRGLGKRLINAAKERARADPKVTGRKVILLQVHENNTKARALYEGLGFRNEGPDGESTGEIWMSLRAEDCAN